MVIDVKIRIKKSKRSLLIALLTILLLASGIGIEYANNLQLKSSLNQEKQKVKLSVAETKAIEKQLTSTQAQLKETKQKLPLETNPQPIEYQTKYPNLYATRPESTVNPGNKVYLTFDDGPSDNTIRILDVLKENNIKATFFLQGKNVAMHPNIVKRIVDEGHAIGIHTNTHDYTQVYQNVDTFLSDYDKCLAEIEAITDYPVSVTRHPGGSINHYNASIYEEINSELLRRGFVYFDWNIDSGDSSQSKQSPQTIIGEVNYNMARNTPSIILMHDGTSQSYAAEILPELIAGIKANGGQFDVLTNAVPPVAFDYRN